jgi:hypothetical protein
MSSFAVPANLEADLKFELVSKRQVLRLLITNDKPGLSANALAMPIRCLRPRLIRAGMRTQSALPIQLYPLIREFYYFGHFIIKYFVCF